MQCCRPTVMRCAWAFVHALTAKPALDTLCILTHDEPAPDKEPTVPMPGAFREFVPALKPGNG
jgi:hypothetical protein